MDAGVDAGESEVDASLSFAASELAIKPSGDQIDLTWAPGLVDPRLERAVHPQDGEPAPFRYRLDDPSGLRRPCHTP